MKQKTAIKELKDRTVASVCREACRKVEAQIARAKAVVFAEWSDALNTQRHAVRLALNEAEALAWQTMYPHLVFPILATEKVQAVVAWNSRQQRLWWKTPTVNG
jgi:hypothetical protein